MHIQRTDPDSTSLGHVVFNFLSPDSLFNVVMVRVEMSTGETMMIVTVHGLNSAICSCTCVLFDTVGVQKDFCKQQ